MKGRIIGHCTTARAAALILMPAAQAQGPAPGLQDLVGAKGSSGEQVLQKRGYAYVKGEKSSNDSYTYWRRAKPTSMSPTLALRKWK